MQLALTLLAIALASLLVHGIASRLGLLTPLLLLAAGAAISFVPWVPDITLSSEVVLIGLLPPLLYATAISTSLVDLKAQRVAIAGLSIALVLVTALGVAVVASALLPISFALAFALGAIVAPPDAVAATAVARAIGLPRRAVTLLEGESLLNDATALVSLRTAMAAAGLAAGHAGVGDTEVTIASVGRDFVRAALGGVLIGYLAYKALAVLRTHTHSPVVDTTISFIAPFASYLPAELVHSSGVLAVVTTGLLLGHRAPVLQNARSRLSERSNWASIQFILENAVFLVIGLQLSSLVDDVRASVLGLGSTLLIGLAVLVTVLALRPAWIFPLRWLRARLSRRERDRLRPWQESLVVSWAGMRGVVTLAAALLLPHDTPHRPTLVLVAMTVTIGTLLIQGTTLPLLARTLGVHGPDPREDALQEATVTQAAVVAGLRRLEELPDVDEDAAARLRQQARQRVNRVWERLGRSETESPSDAYRRIRLPVLQAERAELLRIRDSGLVDHQVLAQVLGALDAEESTLESIGARTDAVRSAPLLAPERITGECEHQRDLPESVVPREPDGCEECLAKELTWLHLRVCLSCGHVGCCDSSHGHATAHHEQTGHPVMRSLEPGEAWRWCFVDETLV
ncbi:Na+/H+ antiporter [Janibacter corallicola]|uniref:Na+/H+ antiporter n=1 Tax=Janibacter corallicola TaxID=415212 RepID=UPI0008343B77|nr:Na+/H+ antiporter [Janibacter corallicola]